ncbi:PEP-CTERM sorting domain-containing protein [Vibrio alfacsensis]|uniref:PEP-CTERM sorting domain-containing protein n=1 Tax=Vibrio alfacsensis TaxID=1074311 RepID=A0ABN5PCQ3_9VIBR|nr:PEP-CTERM sorting domain-containing protein [Vibrio alfacsensis]AXY00944.1 PEP-CTERM sorting domain-containing protein [Vibrio alfacsensis]
MKQSLLFSLMAYALPFAALSAPIYTIDRLGLIDEEHTLNDGSQRSNVTSQNDAGQVVGTSERYGELFPGGQSAWQYSGGVSTRIGFYDTEHTSSVGYQFSSAFRQNEAGQVVGISRRYSDQSSNGQSAWQASGGVTARLGFYDDDHTSGSGYQLSSGYWQNEAGQVLGRSTRFNGNQSAGQTAWQSTGGVSLRVGLTDVEHTATDGTQYSNGNHQNEAGHVIGNSIRYVGQQSTGRSAWQSIGGVTTRLGFIDSQHTRSDGYRVSNAALQNEQGQVVGSSNRFNGLQYAGSSAWQSTNGVVQRLGFTDVQHTRSDGYQSSSVYGMNESGQVIGNSDRFNGSTGVGSSAWLATGGVATRIGLMDVDHTSSSGLHSSYAYEINEAGQVAGVSQRYDGDMNNGQSAWQYSDGAATRIGLTDGLHTRSDGLQLSSVLHQNEAGQVVGYSENYTGYFGEKSIWQSTNGLTTRIGLFGAEHTGVDGEQDAEFFRQNEAGQVAGHSVRYSDRGENGQTAWFYDDDLDLTFEFDLLGFDSSVYEYSYFTWLDESGFGLGIYGDGMGLTKAFGFSLDDLFFDLGDSVLDGLDANGWDELNFANLFNASGQIAGYGNVSSDVQGAFQLTRVSEVPEPSALAVLGFGVLLVGVVRRRKSLKV